MPFPRFDYMEFAKTDQGDHVRFPLAGSGFNLEDPGILDVDLSAVRLTRQPDYGHPALRAAIAKRYGVSGNEALPLAGTSLGIFLVAAALLSPGDHVLVEQPAYEAMIRVPEALGAVVDRFERRFEEGWVVDPDRVVAALHPKTRMIAISNLHNPTGVRLSPEVEAALVDLAARRGITLFLDEVYRDFLEEPVGTAYAASGPVVIASSLTKVYGLGGLRAGWLIGPPDILARAARVVDLLHVNDPAPMLPFVLAGFVAAERLRERHLALSREGRSILDNWMRRHPEFGWVPPDGGLCSFPRLPGGCTGTHVHERLLREEATLVVPGHYFEDDRHIRLGVGGGPAALAGGLEALERVAGLSG
ncbi:MAG: pyridoxal phosphate-dependent aminotransferase [Candidatus Eisenbacteria bacterium]|nr:pyridoxal phosphate-dependent aminotransferase [Candidatus Eisenbacteria bacterium]